MLHRRPAAVGFIGAALLLALVATGVAQERIRLFGTVQWVAASTMQVMTVSGTSVAVDLRQADQSAYQALRQGEMVVIDGVLSGDRRRLVAHEIRRDPGGIEAP